MGFLATVAAFARSVVAGAQAPEVKLSRGGSDTLTAGHFAPPGDDAQPLAGDVAYVGEDRGAGAAQIAGYQDPKTPPLAAAGEKRIYSRSGPGTVAAEVWLKANGAVLIVNGSGSIELDPAGNVTVTTPAGTFGAATHTHTTPFGPSGPPIPNT